MDVVFGLVLLVLGLLISYFVIRAAVREGVKAALRERDDARMAERATRQIVRPEEEPGSGPDAP